MIKDHFKNQAHSNEGKAQFSESWNWGRYDINDRLVPTFGSIVGKMLFQRV